MNITPELLAALERIYRKGKPLRSEDQTSSDSEDPEAA